ncbi:MAG: nitrogen fixation protein NifZ [Betaproteobacteria bacterium HGW-Betaproteobacteria-11]|jgi:nitrogen fixation protein NifZ|nr:MAG: nitrogen fixation protein NifZ [Betaproteobacteria bacterium HGW-Betaproteobacteria-11]
MTPSGQYAIGEIVFSRELLVNDGGIPGLAAEAVLATPGRRGVVVNIGHVEIDPDQQVYLVRFESAAGALGELGPPVGCLPDELTQDEAWAKALQ